MSSDRFFRRTITITTLSQTESDVADVETALLHYTKQFADLHEPALRYSVDRETLAPAGAAAYAQEIGVDPAVFGLSSDGTALQLELF